MYRQKEVLSSEKNIQKQNTEDSLPWSRRPQRRQCESCLGTTKSHDIYKYIKKEK